MRSLTIAIGILFLSGGAAALAGEPAAPPPAPGEGEAKPKTEEELLGEKIAEVLAPLKTVMEAPEENQDKIWEKAEADLLVLGAKAVPALETLLPKKDEKGTPVYSEKLKELLGRTDPNAAAMVERVLRAQGWVSPEDRSKRESLMKELRDLEVPPEQFYTGFIELGSFGVEGLREEWAAAAAGPPRDRILEVLCRMAKQGCLETAPFLLDLAVEKDAKVRVRALEAFSDLTYDNDQAEFTVLDKTFQREEAYPLFVGLLRLDAEAEVRYCAALLLGRMEIKEAAQELVNVLDDPKEKVKVKDEAARALTLIERSLLTLSLPEDPDKRIKVIKGWWGQKGNTFPPQIKAAPPVRKPRSAGKEEPPKDGGGKPGGGK